MALETTLRRRKRMSMTSLIDVIFLLLLFFMLSSTFSKYGEIELSAAGQGVGIADTTTPLFLTMKPGGMLLNGVPVQIADLPTTLAPAPGDGDQMVLISLSDKTTSQELVDVLSVLRAIRGVRVLVLQ